MNRKTLRGKALADLIAVCADSKKAEHIIFINLIDSAGIADWFVICQGDNTAHTRAIADAIVDGLKQKRVSAWHVEGKEDGRWILLDYSDVVAHVMLPEVREYYGLEDLWPGAVRISLEGRPPR